MAIEKQSSEAVATGIYDLHEFNPAKIVTGQINLNTLTPINYQPYPTNVNGTVTIDKNSDLEFKRNLIPLNVTKYEQSKFNEVVDIKFIEFISEADNSELESLRAQLRLLSESKAELEAVVDSDEAEIERLRSIIADLESRTALLEDSLNTVTDTETEPTEITNSIPNILFFNEELIANTLNDRIMSKNRKYVAIMQPDRNFVIYKGDFNENGIALSDAVLSPIWSTETYVQSSANFNSYKVKVSNNGLGIYNVDNSLILLSVDKSLTNKSKLVLDNEGVLSLVDSVFSDPIKIWSKPDKA